jgi:CheY-like chemotaxis protein
MLSVMNAEGASPNSAPLILIVDDHADSREMYTWFLFENGFCAVPAETAEDALAAIEATHPNAVVTDVVMPEMSGIELLRTLRASEDTRDIPVVVVSARQSAVDRQQAYDAGCDGFLGKPCAPDVLAAEIHRVLNARERRNGATEVQP